MKYALLEGIVESFSHPIQPTVQVEPDFQTIHAIRKFLQANVGAIDTHLGEGVLRHLGIIVSKAAYAIVAPTCENGIMIWVNPTSPGRAPAVIDQGTAAQLSAAIHSREEAVLTFCTYNTVQQSLKKHIITVFKPMYLDILNENMVGFANITAREILEHLFLTYDIITAVDLEQNFEQMRKEWTNQWRPCSSRFKIVLRFLRQEEW
jgi:hypothetical protein